MPTSVQKSLTRRAALLDQADRQQRQIRAIVFVLAAGISVVASTSKSQGAWGWIAALAWVGFVVTIVIHRMIRARRQRLAWRERLERRLQGLRELKSSDELTWNYDPGHDDRGRAVRRLIRDLDILPSAASPNAFASLFPFFLSTSGQTRFLELLTKPTEDLGEIRRRQETVLFWEKHVVLRRKIQRISSTLEEALETRSLTEHAAAAVAQEKSWPLFVVVVVGQLLFFSLWAIAVAASTKWIGTIGLVVWFGSYYLATRKIDLFAAYPRAMSLGRNLRVLRDVSLIFARVSDRADAGLHAFAGEKNPANVLRDIERASGALGIRQNPLLALLINFFVPWDLYWTIRFDEARRHVVGALPAWLDGLANLEAVLALAEWNSAHGRSLPQFAAPVQGPDAVLVEATNLAHPLLPVAKRVANNLLMTRIGRNHLITGSNMSGKSTFLRAIGLNLLLAQAGAKVVANSMRLIPVRLESSMRPADSLSDGFSSFYSEVSDLVEIIGHARKRETIFYLIDEIFRGTNNRERRIGAEAVIRELAKTSALGFVTTHDLDLATLEGVVEGVENHHFRDDVTDGRMTFSYEYRKGPCPSTNALKVMGAAGIPVP